ncbi:MAG TPA: hypothetical protein VFW00_03595, partial [Rhodocyclaceae bacterium]|nr:hypothetical protein [Rhodocyclaceae bacterium]
MIPISAYTMPVGSLSNSDATGVIIDWLTSQPSLDIADETRSLGQHLEALYAPGISGAQFHRCIELFYSRAVRL